MTTIEPAPTGLPIAPAVDARRDRIRALVRRLVEELAPTWPLERFAATNPLLSFEEWPHERAVVDAARLLGVRAEEDETSYRDRYAAGRISRDDLDAAIAASEPGASPERLGELRRELLEASPVTLPRPEPVLLSEWHDVDAGTSWAAAVDDLTAWWCAAYLGDHPAWAMPGAELGLYRAWRSLAGHDARLRRLTPDATFVATLPERADDAVLQLLIDLAVDRPDHAGYLRRHLVRTAGWTSALVRERGVDSDDLMGLLALRLATELAHFTNGTARARARRAAEEAAEEAATNGSGAPDDEVVARRLAIWRDASERGYRDELLTALTSAPGGAKESGAEGSDAEGSDPEGSGTVAVFCIDPRSEGMRRHLEHVGGHRTVGFAGFFGLPVAIADLGAPPAPSCPVIVAPEARSAERDVEPSPRAIAGRQRRATVHAVHAGTKRAPGAPFALAEALGWLAGPHLALRTLAPAWTARRAASIRAAIAPTGPTEMAPDPEQWWTLPEQVQLAASILATTGIGRLRPRLVLLAGHGSRHVNNLHRAALDCGACGGRRGGNNARLAARLLNDPAVREGLAARGTDLTGTWFVAAEHDTVADEVHVLDREQVPASHLGPLASLECDLAEAGRRLAAERRPTLPGSVGRRPSARASSRRARGADWAQVIPEWGLAGNAAIVVGPRALTAGVDLGRRVFLHEYDSAHDEDGSTLASILGGPLLVAHWINAQYRASTIDRDRLGAGRKPAHNLIGGVGVVEGAGGDIRLGLPEESVSIAGAGMHDPMRLLTVVDAPAPLLDTLLAAAPNVARLVDNGWITLVARPDDDTATWVRRHRDGSWAPEFAAGSTETAADEWAEVA